ncbi:MAG: HAD family hydrolase [Phycisphaerae bacterium]|nr:HAD family hydrolase [Phycisphaerae bacterium]
MARPAIFFDRDNTLIVGNDYLGDPQQVILVPGAADAVAKARALGYSTVVVSNQSGVARGMFGEDDVRAVNARMDEMLRAENPEAIIERHEFCPYHPQAPVDKYRVDSDCRKPKPGMLLAAAIEMDLDLGHSWLIGDAARDVEAGKAAGCRAILFNERSLPMSPAARATPRVPPDFVATSLAEAMAHIEVADAPPTPKPVESSVIGEQPTPQPSVPAEATIATALARVPAAQPPPPEQANPIPPPPMTPRLEMLVEQVLHEMRRRHEQPHVDFSVSKLLAGIVQVVALAIAFLAYLNRDSGGVEVLMLAAIFLQAMVSSLLIMARQK